MAITLTGTGGLFTRLGRIIYALNSLNSYMGSASFAGLKSIGYSVADINAQYLAADQNLIDPLYTNRDTARLSMQQWENYLSGLSQSTVIQMANDDTPLPTQTLTPALNLLIGQMGSATASVNQPTTSASAASAARPNGSANNGTGVFIASVKAATGKTQDYVFNETITAACTADSQTGGATVNQEQFTLTTPVAATDTLGWNFPLGSGVTGFTLNAVDPTVNNGGSQINLLINSDFQNYSITSNLPDQWLKAVGTLGTDIIQGSGGSGLFGTSSLAFVRNAGSLPSVYQPFAAIVNPGVSTGTQATLLPDTVYAVNIWAKRNSSITTTGTLALSLVDGSNTVINDDNGVANTITKAMSTLSTTYTAVNGFFRTPAILPAAVSVQLYTSVTIADTGGQVNMCGLSMTPAPQLYASGPWVAIFAGGTKFIVPDQFTLAINNNYAGVFQVGLDKMLGLRVSGLQIPSSGSPTINDNLVG